MDSNITEDHPRFVDIEYFVCEMLGFKAKSTYYNHRNDPGWPQRVYPTGQPKLVYAECVAYQKQLMESRDPPPRQKLKVRGKRLGRPPKAA
jgi:hypothetical protein